MGAQNGFPGFSKRTFKFLHDLEKNNTREWFQENREIFDEDVLGLAQDFVVEMGERLKSIFPKIVAIPKTDKSIFRMYRDTRFGTDKTPYKTHVGILFWEGAGKKLDNSGFYLQLNKSSIMIAAGMHCLPKELLTPFRDSVSHTKRGTELADIVQKISMNPDYKIGGEHYKRVPRGYDSEHPNADLLRHNGVYAYYESSLPKGIHSPKFVDYCYEIFNDFSPLHKWFLGLTG